ncbi:hypothetical protein [Phenylobacterium aquaticum]|uniref:hypothetical protein n=1 Tax=Phenylobacterium aquaticum TaxID=1763816 RepID=UPI0026EF6249|nr:hypothetical protein [Phenylobacterium aquaticum]
MVAQLLRDDPHVDWDEALEFRLTYQGTLLSETEKGRLQKARATHKQEIRKALHPQLRHLWKINPYLASASLPPPPTQNPGVMGRVFGRPKPENSIEGLAERFKLNGYRFVPLVTESVDVLCSVDVLFLRAGPPGSVYRHGDIDNRLKTLFDGLTMPIDAMQLGDYATPSGDEDPFFCLLQNDAMITRASVETDTLLDPNCGPNDARVIMTIKLWPHSLRSDNIGFG